MKKRLKNYITHMDAIDTSSLSAKEKEEMASSLLVQIGFFQHERMIHLIVTVTFAILLILSVLCCFVVGGNLFYALTVLFFVLLIPYIGHYYTLENGVQKLYEIYDRFERTN